jgi:hypothetical protein
MEQLRRKKSFGRSVAVILLLFHRSSFTNIAPAYIPSLNHRFKKKRIQEPIGFHNAESPKEVQFTIDKPTKYIQSFKTEDKRAN